MKRKPILVTGAHRSGTTWIGNIFSSAPGVGYIHEPFNKWIKSYNAPFKHQLEYIHDKSSIEKQKEVLKYLNSFQGFPNRYSFGRLIKFSGFKPYLKSLIEVGNLKRRLFDRIVYKDPIAILSAEWFYKNMNSDVVVMIRHPAAFTASLKVKNWTYDFNHLWDQKDLMQGPLFNYKDEVEAHVNDPKNIIEQGILLWNIYYELIYMYKQKYENEWSFIRHEDVSLQPIAIFKSLFNKLGLSYTPAVEKAIIASTTSKVNSLLQRDSEENIKTWKDRLTKEEVERIKMGTKKIWIHFYSEEDWN